MNATVTTPETAYRALSHVAEQIGRENYKRSKPVRGKRPRYSPTDAHRDVMQAMLDVMSGELSVNDAFALIHRSDVEKERFGR